MPKADDMLCFENYHNGPAAPLVIYADFEAINEKVHGCQSNNDKSYTESYQKHKDCGYGYKMSVVMMISMVNQFKYIEEKMLFISSCKNVRRSSMVQKNET